jgi:hypothetical protein
MQSREQIVDFIRTELAAICGTDPHSYGEDTPLIGSRREIRSRDLVELLLRMEEYAEDRLGTTFDWASDSAMSEVTSSLRTIGSLAGHLAGLGAAKR